MGENVEQLRVKAQHYWQDVFNSTPYSNFLQIAYIVNKSGKSWEDLLRTTSAKALTGLVGRDALMGDESPSFIRTWWTSGRCTSFTIRIVRHLQELSSPSFDFRFYDLGRHRVARCAKTGILIDSSSTVGVLVLKDGDDWEVLEEGQPNQRKWKWVDSVSKFQRSSNPLQKSNTELSVQECMTVCPREIAERFEPLCFFRSFSGGTARFHGMIKWIPKDRSLTLEPERIAGRPGTKTTIVFDKDGNKDTEDECKQAVQAFVTAQGGPNGQLQWRWGQEGHRPCDVHEKLWVAAKAAWGHFPRIKT
ncbi:hypothetical protein B0J18DRAFT_434665 [Chaetomium sp. MPI-SDFR-AT-0129]|nr:hypothetical protein B0J18DRAFT_434665 [Chaetomium sp. MPI-SDFR-AT-0129]